MNVWLRIQTGKREGSIWSAMIIMMEKSQGKQQMKIFLGMLTCLFYLIKSSSVKMTVCYFKDTLLS